MVQVPSVAAGRRPQSRCAALKVPFSRPSPTTVGKFSLTHEARQARPHKRSGMLLKPRREPPRNVQYPDLPSLAINDRHLAGRADGVKTARVLYRRFQASKGLFTKTILI